METTYVSMGMQPGSIRNSLGFISLAGDLL